MANYFICVVEVIIMKFIYSELSLVKSSSTRMALTSDENFQNMLDAQLRDMKLYLAEQLAIALKPL